MEPFLSEGLRAKISAENPAGTDGFEFVEFAALSPEPLRSLFEQMGFTRVARHKRRPIELYRQGDINFILNADRQSHAGHFANHHGPSASAMAWRVHNSQKAFTHAVERGATPYQEGEGKKTLEVPAIVGIGGSLIYFIDSYGANGSPYELDFQWLGERDPLPDGCGLTSIDHLTHNVFRGSMDRWYQFYQNLFNFRQIRYFDISGKWTGLYSRALTSPCGKIRIPLNESADDQSQIEEYLRAYKGEGIQHIACGCKDIYASVRRLAANGLAFMPPPPDTYYQKIAERLPGHSEPVEALRQNGLLIDGESTETGTPKLLLQIFSKTVIGPIFFEFIERKGDEGFGEGNFKALFESIEADQIARGVLKG